MSTLNIIELRSKNILHLNLEEFTKITTKDDLAVRSLVVISIAGAMRKGKSFLLNFFLTYAYNKYSTTKTIAKPKTFENGSLIDGFSHCGGTVRHTTGIQVWPDIFLHDYPDGKKIAIVFMDTQGTFDYDTKFSECVSIFALSTLLSSVQIYNITNNIQNDHLQYLALFGEYAKLTLDKVMPGNEGGPSFDKLQVLVRDWYYPYQAGYGLEGGKQILDKTFSKSNAEIQQTVSSIKETFKSVECFLLPFPGDVIAGSSRFDGNIERINKTFLDQVALLTGHLLCPENLTVKKINGVELKMGDFVNLIEQSFDILSKYENIPKPQTITAATAESHNFKLIADAVEAYKKSMINHVARGQYLDNGQFKVLHQKFMNESMNLFENADKFETFDSDTNEKWKTHLEDMLVRESNYFLIMNERNQPNNSEALESLIKVVTEQKNMIKELNEKHTQDMLNLINTFRQREDDFKEHMAELTRNFKQSPSAGFDFMGILKKIIDVVPTAITAIGMQRKPLGMAVLVGCSVVRNILAPNPLSIGQ